MLPDSLGNSAFCPVRVKTVASFSAEDPWSQNHRSTFTIEAYVSAARGSIPSADTKPPFGVYFMGLRSSADGVERMLPESLAESWRQNRVKVEALPRLLHQLEPDLTNQDYHIVLGNSILRSASRMIRISAGLAVLLFLAMGFLDMFPLGGMIVLTLVLGGVGWLHPNRLYYWPRARRMRQMEWAAAQS